MLNIIDNVRPGQKWKARSVEQVCLPDLKRIARQPPKK